MTEVKRRLSAIMFSDIVGYSRKMSADEGKALLLLDEHNNIVVPIIEKNGGRVLKFLGDGLLSSYESASDAVRCGTEIQKALAKRNTGKPEDDKILIRIGIHIGDVVVKEGDVFGDGVNIASRIEPLAEPGGICISQTVYDMVKARPEIQTMNLGSKELKNIKEAVNIYKVLIEAGDGEAVFASAPAEPKKKKPGRGLMLVLGVLPPLMIATALALFFLRPAPETAVREKTETMKRIKDPAEVTAPSIDEPALETEPDTIPEPGDTAETSPEKTPVSPPSPAEPKPTEAVETEEPAEPKTSADKLLAGEYLNEGIDLYKSGDYDGSIRFLEKALEKDPGNALAAEYLGLSRDALKKAEPEYVYRLGAPRLHPPGFDKRDRPDVFYKPVKNRIITGLGIRINWGKVVTLRIRTAELEEDGTLGKQKDEKLGRNLDSGLEANIDLPNGYVAVGMGGTVRRDDIKTFVIYGRKLEKGRLTGPVKSFTAGEHKDREPEKSMKVSDRVLIGLSLKGGLRNLSEIKAVTAEIIEKEKTGE